MNQQHLFELWFCLLSVCFLVWLGQAQVPEPAQCLVSGIYNLTRPPMEDEDEGKCWRDCDAEPDCHMALIVIPLRDKKQCLLVNCLNQTRYSYTRHPSTEIRVYPKSTIDDDQRYYLMTDEYGLADETLHCSEFMNCSSCQSGIPRFFYNRTSYRCESFHAGCGSNRNSFETQEGCEALCNKKFRCYRPMQYGAGSSNISMFFYNMKSQSCETFNFSGYGSNGNIFQTEEECENLCGDIKATTTSRPAVTTAGISPPVTSVTADTTVAVPTENTATTTRRPAVTTGIRPPVISVTAGFLIILVVIPVILFVFAIIAAVHCICNHKRPSSVSYRKLSDLDSESSTESESVGVIIEADEDCSGGGGESNIVQRRFSSEDASIGLNKQSRGSRGRQPKTKQKVSKR
ncbi:uncharacterized protein LOC121899149 isoform X2 [Thunnus maccoyii]|uniref:uncharacterized protein LOC121899149 isoform X2 n=1 Tax=Thunnus maccoyii TaxID=8240 RepID=UPI001C4BFDC5|nr:uncharacterized protein LOC121899149 isoform X2 [Thunnus maccoyii]